MPTKPPAPGVVEMAVLQTLGDDLDVLNVYHLLTGDIGGGMSAADLLAGAQEFFTLWTGHFSSLLGGDQFAKAVIAKDLGVADGEVATYVAPAPVQGGTGGGDFPAGVALVASWKEGISYKGGHARSYFAGIPRSGGSDPQHVTGAYATALQTAANAFIASIPVATWPAAWDVPVLSVVHYVLHKVVQDPPRVLPILSAIVNTRFDSQRRRNQS